MRVLSQSKTRSRASNFLAQGRATRRGWNRGRNVGQDAATGQTAAEDRPRVHAAGGGNRDGGYAAAWMDRDLAGVGRVGSRVRLGPQAAGPPQIRGCPLARPAAPHPPGLTRRSSTAPRVAFSSPHLPFRVHAFEAAPDVV